MRQFRLFVLLACVLTLAGCVSSRVTASKTLAPNQAPLERVVLSLHPAGTDKDAGQAIFGDLLPHLIDRMPKVFAASGLETRVLGVDKFGPDDTAWRGASLRVLTVTPLAARHNKRAGHVLHFRAVLLDPARNNPLWRTDVAVSTQGDATDDRIADELASTLIDKLREDHLVR